MKAKTIPQKEKFARFKNRLLGPSFLNDGNHFAKVLGRNDFIFWDHLQEKAPYLPLITPIDDVLKGHVILERIEIEPSPKRMADLLQGAYNAFAFHTLTPAGDMDDHWRQFASWLERQIESDGLSDSMKIQWTSKPEEHFTPEPFAERYYTPGEITVTYTGLDWSEKESKRILEEGFRSRVLDAAHSLKPGTQNPLTVKAWFERPMGLIAIGVIATLVGGGLVYWLGWN